MAVCTIRASDLAAVAGRHPYRAQAAELERLRALLGGGGARKEQQVRAQQALGPTASPAAVVQAAQTLKVAPAAAAALDGSQKRLADARATQAVTCEQTAAAQAAVATARKAHAEAVQVLAAAGAGADAAKRARVHDAAKQAARTVEAAKTVERAAAAATATAADRAREHQAAVAQHMPLLSKRVVDAIGARSLQQAKTQRTDAVLQSLPLRAAVAQHERMAEGTHAEASVLERARARFAPALAGAAEPRGESRRLPLGTVDGPAGPVRVELVGKCDALCDDAVVEIKTRKNRLFEKLPDYERVQLLAYLHLYGRERGYLVEAYGDELRHYPVERDGADWRAVVDAALACVSRALTG